MNASMRDLRQHVDQTPPPPLDVEGIIARGDARLRRRRAALATGSASLVVLAIVTGVATLTDSSRRSNPPVDAPSPSVIENAEPTPPRPLTYTDDYTVDPGDIHWLVQSIQYGDRTVRPTIDATALDLTDDGLVMVAPDGGVHFTDGGTTEKIGDSTDPGGMSWAEWGVKTSTSGSLAAWFTPEDENPSLVVYDTQQQQVLTEVPRPDCPEGCLLEAVVGERVYWSEEPGPNWSTEERWLGRPLMMLDVRDATLSETDVGALAADLRSQPRGFVMGDDYDTGEVVNQDVNIEAVFFAARGPTLELQRIVSGAGTDAPVFGYGGFDTTGRRLDLRLPPGYTPAESSYNLFQWLDDDRFAVMAGATHGSGNFGEDGDPGYGDILVCDIAGERCTLAAPGPVDDCSSSSTTDCTFAFRLVPHLTLPN